MAYEQINGMCALTPSWGIADSVLAKSRDYFARNFGHAERLRPLRFAARGAIDSRLPSLPIGDGKQLSAPVCVYRGTAELGARIGGLIVLKCGFEWTNQPRR